tara:strand:+ start:209 stop:496 length:288 start_codon:yes stop_codon:yes gene_type:complete
MITIITKIELETVDTLKHIEFAYTTDTNIVDDVNTNYDQSLGVYLAENRTALENGTLTIDSFFVNGVTYVYEARMIVDTIEGLDLIHVTDINNLP